MEHGSDIRRDTGCTPVKKARLIPLTGLCLAIGFAALYLRFAGVGSPLPTPQEAGSVWPAWAASSGMPAGPSDPGAYSAGPLVDTLAWLLFQCLGASEAIARAGPALTGSLLVFLPLLMRSWLGNLGSLAAVLLLAADPWQRAYSRSADGVMYSAFLALAAVAWMDAVGLGWRPGQDTTPNPGPAHYPECRLAPGTHRGHPCADVEHRVAGEAVGLRRWVIPGALGALFAMSGVEFWSLAPPVLLYFCLTGMRGSAGATGGWQAFAPWPTRRIWAAFFATILMAGVLFGIRWENAARFGSSLSDWLESWGTAAAAGYSWVWVCARFLREQPLTLAAGLAGLLWLWRERADKDTGNSRGRAAALAIWATWGLVLAIPGGRGPAGLLVSDLALKLAAGFALGKILTATAGSWNPSTWVVRTLGSLGLILLGLIWFSLNRHVPPLSAKGIWLSYAIGAAAWIACALSRRARGSFTRTLLPAVLLLAIEFHGSRELDRQMGSEPVFFNSIAHPDLQRLKSDLGQWICGYQQSGASVRVRIGAGTPHGRLVAWHLREFMALDSEPSRPDSDQKVLWITGERVILQQPPEGWPPIRFGAVLHRVSRAESRDQVGEAPTPAPSTYSSEAVWLWLPRH